MKELVKCIEDIKTLVNSIDEKIFEKHYKVPLNCSGLPILNSGDEHQCLTQLPNFFEKLDVSKKPVIYWFIVTSNHTSKEIMNKVKYAAKNVKRRFPMLERKRTYKFESKVLYVGKTCSKLRDRMISHLGYHKKNDNHGLQLSYWAVDFELKLELNYIVLPEKLEGLIDLFERELSKQLRPIIGKEV